MSRRLASGLSAAYQLRRRGYAVTIFEAARELGREVLPLPAEWWDFRLIPAYSEQFAPLSDRDLPPAMRMT